MLNKTRTLSLLLLLMMTALMISACGGAAAIAVEPTGYDFGDIPAAAPVSGKVQIRNEGRGVLRLAGLRTSCGCTTAQAGTESLAPGERTDLVITFDPQAHDGLYGPLLRIVYVESNDPDTPELEIPVTVNVLPPQEAVQ